MEALSCLRPRYLHTHTARIVATAEASRPCHLALESFHVLVVHSVLFFTMWEGKEIYLRCKGKGLCFPRGADFISEGVQVTGFLLSLRCYYRSCFRTIIIVVALVFEKMLELSPVKQQRLAQTIITAFKHRFAASTTTDNLSSVSQSYALGSNHIFY
jgi:hypothetical protein